MNSSLSQFFKYKVVQGLLVTLLFVYFGFILNTLPSIAHALSYGGLIMSIWFYTTYNRIVRPIILYIKDQRRDLAEALFVTWILAGISIGILLEIGIAILLGWIFHSTPTFLGAFGAYALLHFLLRRFLEGWIQNTTPNS